MRIHLQARQTSFLYSIHGQTLASNVGLSSYAPSPSLQADISFLWQPNRLDTSAEVSWIYHWRRPDDTEWLSSGQMDAQNGYLLRLHGAADFRLSFDGCRIRANPIGSFSLESLAGMLADCVLPFAFTLQGRHVFHAGGSSVDGQAVIFLGESGAGKSTLAANLLAHGFPVLADDYVVLRPSSSGAHLPIEVLPGRPKLRLWPGVKKFIFDEKPNGGTDGEKCVVEVEVEVEGGTASLPTTVPLQRVYLLQPSDGMNSGPAVRSVPGPEALIELFRHAFRLDYTSKTMLVNELQSLSAIIESVAVKRLCFPRTLEGMAKAAALVIAEQKKAAA